MHYFVRHTRVAVSPDICYGQTDVNLADSFIQEAALVKNTLSQYIFHQVYSSPLQRCRQLAEYCGYSKPITHPALMEMNFGSWEMQKWDALDMQLWANDWIHNAPPKGESLKAMYQRISAFLSILPTDKNILIFTHKGVINCAKAFYSGIALSSIFDEPIDYGQVVFFATS